MFIELYDSNNQWTIGARHVKVCVELGNKYTFRLCVNSFCVIDKGYDSVYVYG
jgi:hypothetical protein